MALDAPGPYQLQAAIAALHAQAPRARGHRLAADPRAVRALLRLQPSPVVELNRAVAVAMADGPAAGLPLVDALAGELDGYHLFHAARADLLRRLGRPRRGRRRVPAGARAGHEPAGTCVPWGGVGAAES